MRKRLVALATGTLLLAGCAGRVKNYQEAAREFKPARADTQFLDEIGHRAFLYFWEQGNPHTGLVRDRSLADGTMPPNTDRYSASIAATGFGLTAMVIGADHHWAPEPEIRERVRSTLRFFAHSAPGKNGFYYHWLDPQTGDRVRNSEVSSIDSALLLAGVLTARARFADDAEVYNLATQIYIRMDFHWLMDSRGILSHGWRPDVGMLKSNWDTYSEHMILYLLAIGSPAHSIPAKSWYSWARPKITFGNYSYISDGPLFTQQYSHAWVDFRHLVDGAPSNVDWFQNAVTATEANRAFCIGLHDKFPDYGPDLWGITASDSVRGYQVWVGPPTDTHVDGTVVPCAAGGSLMLTPELSLATLEYMRSKYAGAVFAHYGFTDAFNPLTNWVDPEIIGIDQGITLLSAENARDGGVWQWFMRNREIHDAMAQIGFHRDASSTMTQSGEAEQAGQ